MQHFTKKQMQVARRANLYDYLMRNHLSDCIKDGNEVSTPMWCIAPMDVVSKPEHSSGNTISERCHRCL